MNAKKHFKLRHKFENLQKSPKIIFRDGGDIN